MIGFAGQLLHLFCTDLMAQNRWEPLDHLETLLCDVGLSIQDLFLPNFSHAEQITAAQLLQENNQMRHLTKAILLLGIFEGKANTFPKESYHLSSNHFKFDWAAV